MLTVYPRTNKQNQKKKRKVEPPTPQVGTAVSLQWRRGGERAEGVKLGGTNQPKTRAEERDPGGAEMLVCPACPLLPSNGLWAAVGTLLQAAGQGGLRVRSGAAPGGFQ